MIGTKNGNPPPLSKGTSPFLETSPFLAENSEPPLLSENRDISTPPPLKRGWGHAMETRTGRGLYVTFQGLGYKNRTVYRKYVVFENSSQRYHHTSK